MLQPSEEKFAEQFPPFGSGLSGFFLWDGGRIDGNSLRNLRVPLLQGEDG